MTSSMRQSVPVEWGSALGKRARDSSTDESDVFGGDDSVGARTDEADSDGIFSRQAKRHHTYDPNETPGRLGLGATTLLQYSDVDMGSPLQSLRLGSPVEMPDWRADRGEAAAGLAAISADADVFQEDTSSSAPSSASPVANLTMIRPRAFGSRADTPLVKSGLSRHAPTSPSPLAAGASSRYVSLRSRQRSMLSQNPLEMMEEDGGADGFGPSRLPNLTDLADVSPNHSGSGTPMSASSSPWQSREGSPIVTRRMASRHSSAGSNGQDENMDLGSPLRTPTKGGRAAKTPPQAFHRHQHSPGIDRPLTPPGGRQMLRYTMGFREDCELCRLKTPGHYSHLVHRPSTNA